MAREKPLNKIITYIKNTLACKDNIIISYKIKHVDQTAI